MKVKIVNRSKYPLPSYGTSLYAVILKSLERKLISTGLFIELREKYEAQIRPRSGFAILEEDEFRYNVR